MRLEFFTDPATFLEFSADHLAERPVVSTVVATVAERAAADMADGLTQDPRDWYVVARDGDAVCGAGMRTAPFGARPLFLLPMPDDSALLLARTLHERGEDAGAVNGALPAVRAFADETARLAGASVAVGQHTRLFELADLVEPAGVPGRLRSATREDLDVATAWFDAFMRDADEQAGREPGSSAHEAPDEADMLRRIERRRIWLWEDENGEVVHLTGVNAPAFGVARIGPVYTPKEQRGRGYASAAVADVSRQIIESGSRACLFTDQANPTSNKIYEALGYRPVVDMANLRIE
jgi:GNAT superfamily N-acetyltransferase